MVVQKAVNNLKNQSHEDKQAVAGGIAILVIVVLLVGWGFLFLRKIQKGPPATIRGSALPEDQFDYSLIDQTEKELSRLYRQAGSQFETLREGSLETQDPRNVNPSDENRLQENAFGTPGSI